MVTRTITLWCQDYSFYDYGNVWAAMFSDSAFRNERIVALLRRYMSDHVSLLYVLEFTGIKLTKVIDTGTLMVMSPSVTRAELSYVCMRTIPVNAFPSPKE